MQHPLQRGDQVVQWGCGVGLDAYGPVLKKLVPHGLAWLSQNHLDATQARIAVRIHKIKVPAHQHGGQVMKTERNSDQQQEQSPTPEVKTAFGTRRGAG
jgi:hypothetical protein